MSKITTAKEFHTHHHPAIHQPSSCFSLQETNTKLSCTTVLCVWVLLKVCIIEYSSDIATDVLQYALEVLPHVSAPASAKTHLNLPLNPRQFCCQHGYRGQGRAVTDPSSELGVTGTQSIRAVTERKGFWDKPI